MAAVPPVWDFLRAHETEDILIVYWLFSAAIGAMPMPDAKSSKFYGWLFAFLNTFSANIFRVAASKIPQVQSQPQAPPGPTPPSKT